MTTLVGDFRAPVDPTALPGQGLSGALRYWAKQHGSANVVGITAAEVERYDTAGVPLGTVYEDTTAGWMSGGASAGAKAAAHLLAQFRAVGWTPSSLYFAADANTLASSTVDACLDGAAQVFGWKPDLYAYTDELTAANMGGHSRRSWLTGHFPGTTVAAVQAQYPWLHLYQCQGSQPAGIPTTVTVSGVTGDVNIALRRDWNGADVELIDKLDPIKLSDGKTYTLTVGDVLRGMAQYIAGSTAPGASTSVHPSGQYVARVLSLADIQAAVAATDADVKQADTDVKTTASSVLAAIAAGMQVTLSADQAADIETQLAKALPGYTVNIVPAQ